MKDSELKLLARVDSQWAYMDEHVKEIRKFLTTDEKTVETPKLVATSVQLILSELLMRHEYYSKYPVKLCSTEDLVDMTIDSMSKKMPETDDIEGVKFYHEGVRRVMWGHIKNYSMRLGDILKKKHEGKTVEETCIKSDENLFMECLVIILVECMIRRRELQILENGHEI